jgi:hypothetical protein
LFNGKTGRRKKLKLGGSKYGRKVRRWIRYGKRILALV